MLNRQETDSEKSSAAPSSKSLGANVLKLLSSKVASQVVVLATAPIIVRLFSPESFGVRQIFVTIVGVIAVITCLRYELSIPLGKSKEEASASFILSLLLSLAFALIVLALVPLVKEKASQSFKSPELNTFFWLVPIAILIVSSGSILRYWAAREERFGTLALSDLSRALGRISIPIAYALVIKASAAGLLAGYFASEVFCILLLFSFLGRKLISDIKNSHLSFKMLWMVAKQHKKFPIFSTWSGLMNRLSRELPTIILGLYFSKTVVGYYSLGYRFTSLPMNLLGGSISQVFFPMAAKEYDESGTLSTIFSNTFKRLVQIGVFPMLTLALLGPRLFAFVFGAGWIEAGVYAQILAFWLLFMFIVSPLSSVFSILNRQEIALYLNIFIIMGRAASLLIGAIFWSPTGALILFTAFGVLASGGYLVWAIRLSDVSILWASKVLLKYIVYSGVILLPVKLLSFVLGDWAVVLMAVFATILYVVFLLRTEPAFRQFVSEILSKPKGSKIIALL